MVKTSQRVLQYDLPLDIRRERGGGYTAKCTIWPDCYAQGETVDEAVLEVTAVAQTLIELYTEEGLDIPLKRVRERAFSEKPFTVPVIVAAA